MHSGSHPSRRLFSILAAVTAVLVTVALVPGSQAPSRPQSRENSPTTEGRQGMAGAIASWFGLGEAKPPGPSNVALDVQGVPRHDPVPAGAKWPEQKRVKELTGKRTANSSFWQLADGRVQAEVSPTPMFYRDAGGAWQPIDTTVRDSGRPGFVKGNSSNSFASFFGSTSDRLVRFEQGGRWVELGIDGPSVAAVPSADGSRVTYPGVAGGADLVYEVTSTALKENIVVAAAPAADLSYTFIVNAHGVEPRRQDDGSVGFFVPGSGRALWTIPAPFMFDAAGATSHEVTQTVLREAGKTTITVTAGAGWLREDTRKYPVTLDPTIRIQPVPADGQDVQIYSGDVNRNFNDSYQLKVGTNTANTWRSLVRFPLHQAGIPTGVALDDAKVQMFYSQAHTISGWDVALEARKVTTGWDEATATWANMNANMGPVAGNVVVVDDTDTSKIAMTGSWPASTNGALTPFGINSTYRYNNDATAGHTFSWIPTITEDGDYQVEVHFVSEADRASNATYTVQHADGQSGYTVNQTGSAAGVWKTLGTHRFVAGTTGRVTLGDVAGRAVIADAVRLTKNAVDTKRSNISSVWHSFSVRDIAQGWVDNPTANYGVVLKAVDEATKNRGGPAYEAAEYAYNNGGRDYNLPKLVLTWGRQGVSLSPPTTITSTGALLNWSAYADPSPGPGDNIVEYQVHRSIYQRFAPSAATLVAPLPPGILSYQDTSAKPTPADTPDDQPGQLYYYMIAVKTADGQILAAPTEVARLPKAGMVTRLIRSGVTDTTLSQALPDTNADVFGGDPYDSVGNNSPTYGDTRAVVKFSTLDGIPAGASIVGAQLRMWTAYNHGNTDGTVDVYKLTRGFDETTATWNRASIATAWTTAGGDYDPAALSGFNGFTNDPEWEHWDVSQAVRGWLTAPDSNHGLLLRMRDELAATQRANMHSSETVEPLLAPTLAITYLEKTAASTYYAPATPELMNPASTYSTPVSISNPTATTWTPATWELSYKWTRPDGTDVTDSGNQVVTALPRDVAPNGTVDFTAQVKTPAASPEGNKRTDYILRWELRNKSTQQWLSTTDGIAALDQRAAVEEPTSNQLGLEKFYNYSGIGTGAGAALSNNLYSGNTVWSYDALTNPSRGLNTFVRLAYNSLDTSDTVAGYGWSLQASSVMRLGMPLDFHPNPNPTTVKLTDGDGTTHTFTWDPGTSQWVHPKGVHLFLQRLVVCSNQTEVDRAWSMTKPDRTTFFYDCDGYVSSVEDNNGNVMSFDYEVRRSQNKPTKFLRHIHDPTGRKTLTIDYWAKGDTYDYINDTTWTKVGNVGNLTNPHIIDHVRRVTDISGRTLTFTYTDKGLLGELIDGAGSAQPKKFGFQYDMTQGNKNVKLIKAVDPRGNDTNIGYYSRPEDDPKFKWATKTYTDRLDNQAALFAYTDPDGPQGNAIHTTVTDAETHASLFKMDGFGRPVESTNAKQQTTKLEWDADHNVQRLEEANGAVSTWLYDPKTGYPTEIKDAEAFANGWPGTVLTYQTGMNGFWADLISKRSPEGRLWTFAYTSEGDLEKVTDPVGNTTPALDDYTTVYTYDTWGQLESVRDANGNMTTHSDFHASGYPRKTTDALNKMTQFVYDDRGNVTKVTDALLKDMTQEYDTFGRPGLSRVPKDQAAGVFITTPAREYDPNDNVVTTFAPNGAVATAVYDANDRIAESLAPIDNPGEPQRKTSFGYDRVGNPLTATEPNGNVSASDPDDFVTTNVYDEIYQLIRTVNAEGHILSYAYDNVGNVTTVVDPVKNATTDPNDYTTKFEYDRAHRVKKTIDAIGKFTTTTYDKDGLAIASTDQLGVTVETLFDPRGKPSQVKVPHVTNAGNTTYRITGYEYDQVGNPTKVTSPRGMATPLEPNDFAEVTVYDQLNRPKERWSAYDPHDTRYTTPDKTFFTYDDVSRLKVQSSPPSSGETVRNDTSFTYFDNGWIRTSTDPWDILTTYDYNELGGQTLRTITSAGGSSARTMTNQYYPDGKLKTRADDGVPVGKQVVLVDNSDTHNVTTTGTWPSTNTAGNKYGPDYQTNAAGTGADSFTWNLNVPQLGTYEVFVRFPTMAGAASDAKYTIAHNGGSATVTVNQNNGAGTWVSLGSFAFAEGNTHTITLTDQASGTVTADAVKLVRNNSGQTDTEKHDYRYLYDPNGNPTTITDASPGAQVDTYQVAYTSLNQVKEVIEKLATVQKNKTSFTYDPNGAPKTVAHDKQHSLYTYDPRNLLATVTNGASAGDPNAKVTSYTYTDRGERLHEVKGNVNTVDYTYYLDGLPRTQVERKPDTTLVSEHTMAYDLNGNRTNETTKNMNAENHSAYLNTTTVNTYDPRDRIATVTKTGDGAGTETYLHDANNNVISQTLKGVTTAFDYDRNRLRSATTGGAKTTYNYDPFGRLDTITAAGTVTERNIYDGFDHIIENRKTGAGTTKYTFDPMDRTTTKTTDVGTPKEKTTTFNYLGLSGEVLDEEVAGAITKSYQYSPWGERVSQVKHNTDGTKENGFYGYNPHTDVEQITDNSGNTKATYGYTAYGNNDETRFTGIDKPDTADPTKEPYNAYRYNAKRWDQHTGNYDMGFRDYSPGLNRFLTRDTYNGALADMNLGLNPYTGNRYAFGAGNPITNIELDGHIPVCGEDVECKASPTGPEEESTSAHARPPAKEVTIGLDCEVPTVSCTPSQWETELTNGLVAELAAMIPNVPENLKNQVIELCKTGDCSGMGPTQLAWCAHNFDKCVVAQGAAAAQARGASTDLIKGDEKERIAERNAIRHALWVALLISSYGFSEREALLLSTAHEMDDRSEEGRWGTPDSKIDLHNNFIGAKIGLGVLRWKESNPSRSAYNQAVDLTYILARTSNNCSTCLNLLGGTFK